MHRDRVIAFCSRIAYTPRMIPPHDFYAACLRANIPLPQEAVKASREAVEALLGETVLVFAPSTLTAPRWVAHLRRVKLHHFSPRQSGVVCTSAGPLDFTRANCYLATA